MSDAVKFTRQDDTYARLSGRALIWINADAVFIAIVHPMEVAMEPPTTQIGRKMPKSCQDPPSIVPVQTGRGSGQSTGAVAGVRFSAT